MSAIHEALERARDPQRKKDTRGVVPDSPPVLMMVTALVFVLFVVQSALFFRESYFRRKAENKLQQAFLQLNDERGKSLDLLKVGTEYEDRLAKLQKERDRILAEKESLARANKQVEFDNLAKEVKLSQMSKELHKLEVAKLELTEEIRSLKSQPQN